MSVHIDNRDYTYIWMTIYSIHLPQIYLSCDLHSYLGSAYYDKHNGGQRFILRASTAELWWFKASKVENNDKENRLLFFKPGLCQTGFLDVEKNGTIFSRN